jgi:RecB family exonuclease
MATYSHSKLSTFESCKYKYKLRYIDNIKPEFKATVETFMGSRVHETLEKLYKDLKFQKENSLEDLLNFLEVKWEREWEDNIIINKKDYTKENYKDMAKKFVKDYYNSHKPFDDLVIIGLETEDKLKLSDGSMYHIRIDKFGYRDKTYFVCDYKTNANLKSQEEADRDRQLAMYALWVKKSFKDAKNVILKWHMLAFDKDVSSSRSESELKELEKSTVSLIKEIESTKVFGTSPSALCSYCEYQSICPSKKHEAKLEQKTLRDYLKDDGLKLVNEFSELKEKKSLIEEKLEETKTNLIGFAKQEQIEIIYGSNKKVSVKEVEKYSCSEENKEKLENELKKKGLGEEYSQISYLKLYSNIEELPKSCQKLLNKEKDFRVSLSKK